MESLKSLILIKVGCLSLGPGGWAVRAWPRAVPAGWAPPSAPPAAWEHGSRPTKSNQRKLLPGHFTNIICKARPCLVILGLIQMALISMEIFLLGAANSGWAFQSEEPKEVPAIKKHTPSAPFWCIFHTLPLLLFQVLDLYYNQSESWLSSCEWAS